MNQKKSFCRYIFISLLSFVVTIGVTVLLTEVLLGPEEIAYAIALIFVFIMNFLFMRNYIFANREESIEGQFFIYSLSAAGFRGLEYLSFLIVHTWLGVQYQLGIICIQAGSFLLKFFFYQSVVFGRKK